MSKNINKIVAKRIFELRKNKKMTAEALAWAAGLSKSCVCYTEKGDKNSPRIDTINEICNALDMTLAEFFSTFTEKI